VKIKINGEPRDVPEGLSVAALLAHLEMNTGRVAADRKLDGLPRASWAETYVADGDSYEVGPLVGGG